MLWCPRLASAQYVVTTTKAAKVHTCCFVFMMLVQRIHCVYCDDGHAPLVQRSASASLARSQYSHSLMLTVYSV
jgi:hypothetical protein